MPDAITQAVAQWREALRMIQQRFVSLAERRRDVLGFVIVLDEKTEEERIAAYLACAKIPTVEERRAVLLELNTKWPSDVADPPPLVFLKAFNHLRVHRRMRRTVPQFANGALVIPSEYKQLPRPIDKHRWAGLLLYEYGDADGWREYWRITRYLMPLLSPVPRGITWPHQTGRVYEVTWPLTVFRWGLDGMPGFSLRLPLLKTTSRGETVELAHSPALNMPEASADGIAKLLTIEPFADYLTVLAALSRFNKSVQKAGRYIIEFPGCPGKDVATDINLAYSTYKTHIAPILREVGFETGHRGNRPPPFDNLV
jgi:hypothetical protein